MTYANAIDRVLEILEQTPNIENELVEKLEQLRDSVTKRNAISDEKKAEISAARKAKTAAERAEYIAVVAPVIRAAMMGKEPMTAKEIFEATKDNLPEGTTWNKVQAVLLKDMADEVVKTEVRGEANRYCLA